MPVWETTQRPRLDDSGSMSNSTWEDVDLTTHIDAADQGDVAGVIIVAHNDTTTEYDWGIRKNGSTDGSTYIDTLEDEASFFGAIGVDSGDVLELFLGSVSALNVHLVGYLTNNDATFNTNVSAIATGSGSPSFVDVDISSETGSDTASYAFLLTNASGTFTGASDFKLRPNGSTDDEAATHYGKDTRLYGVATDANEVFETQRERADMGVYLAGWYTGGENFSNTNAEVITSTSTSTTAYTVTSATTDMTGVAMQLKDTLEFKSAQFHPDAQGFAPSGISPYGDASTFKTAITGTNSSREFEAQWEGSGKNMYIYYGFEETSASSTATDAGVISQATGTPITTTETGEGGDTPTVTTSAATSLTTTEAGEGTDTGSLTPATAQTLTTTETASITDTPSVTTSTVTPITATEAAANVTTDTPTITASTAAPLTSTEVATQGTATDTPTVTPATAQTLTTTETAPITDTPSVTAATATPQTPTTTGTNTDTPSVTTSTATPITASEATDTTTSDGAGVTAATATTLAPTVTGTNTDDGGVTATVATPITSSEVAESSGAEVAGVSAAVATPLSATATVAQTITPTVTAATATPLTPTEQAVTTDTPTVTTAAATPLTASEATVAVGDQLIYHSGTLDAEFSYADDLDATWAKDKDLDAQTDEDE